MSDEIKKTPRQEDGSFQLDPGHALAAFEWDVIDVEGADWATEMEVTPKVINSSGALQGGLLATLIDMVAGTALLRGENAYKQTATSEMHVSYLEGARVGPVRALATIVRRGGRSAVVRVDVYDHGADDLHVATSMLTFAARR